MTEYHLDYPNRDAVMRAIETGMKSSSRMVRLRLTGGPLTEFRVTGTDGDLIYGRTSGYPDKQIKVNLNLLVLTIA